MSKITDNMNLLLYIKYIYSYLMMENNETNKLKWFIKIYYLFKSFIKKI